LLLITKNIILNDIFVLLKAIQNNDFKPKEYDIDLIANILYISSQSKRK